MKDRFRIFPVQRFQSLFRASSEYVGLPYLLSIIIITSCAETATICRRPCKLTFDLLTLKVVSESRVTWVTPMAILVFLVLSVLD